MAKILVIDDSALMRMYVRQHLEEVGFEVEEFLPLSALEVMDRVRSSPPDLVLSDFNMPHVDGQSVARMVKRTSAAIPVIILTALHDPAKEAALTQTGVARILYKPINGPELVKAVQEVLAKR
jgi:two-component system chemotaxis response regulator CheY